MPSLRRLLVLLVGYVAAAASAVIALMLYGYAHDYIDQSGQPRALAKIVPEVGAIVGMLLAICLPFSWLPLALGLALWRRLVGRDRLLGCIVVGTITGVASLLWFGVVVAGLAHAFDREALTFLPYAAPMGAFGGLVFWAIALRRDGGTALRKTAAPPVPPPEGGESPETSA